LTTEDRVVFDRQWRALMARATERLDLSEVQEALQASNLPAHRHRRRVR
jgi:hypothetical protein